MKVLNIMKADQKNVLGGELKICSVDPMSGFTRTGSCDGHEADAGCHAICAQMTEEFLLFSQRAGNDLTTPRPEYGFPGLKAGDRWCVCAERWEEARLAGKAALVVLESTHESALEYVELGDLRKHALDVAGLGYGKGARGGPRRGSGQAGGGFKM